MGPTKTVGVTAERTDLMDMDSAMTKKDGELEVKSASADMDEGDVGSGSDYDSLFDDTEGDVHVATAQRELSSTANGVQIPGMFFDPSNLIPLQMERSLWQEARKRYFDDGDTNQVMLFERAHTQETECGSLSRLPQFLVDLLDALSTLLRPTLPADIHDLLFIGPPAGSDAQPPSEHEARGVATRAASARMLCARQAILNHYFPGEGITPHVDLLGRYADSIVGVSLGCGTVMDFSRVKSFTSPPSNSSPSQGFDVGMHLYLPARSIIVLTGEARYEWTHGIEKRVFDMVEDTDGNLAKLERGERISITFRWLLPGADVVGA